MNKRYLISLLIVIGSIIIDQLTKSWGRTLETLHFNQGFVMGYFSELPDSVRIIALGSFAGIIFSLFVVLIYIIPQRAKSFKYGLSAIIGGMFGNVIDKIVYGKTVDFIPLKIGDWFIVFNMADVILWIGAGVVLFIIFANDKLLWYPESTRGSFLILRKEQVRVGIIFLLIVFCSSLMLGIFSYTFLNLSIQGMASPTERVMMSFFLTYLALSLLLCIMGFIAGIIVSHKSAGPLYAFELYVEDLISGRDRKLTLREGDHHRQLEKLADKLRSHFKTRKHP